MGSDFNDILEVPGEIVGGDMGGSGRDERGRNTGRNTGKRPEGLWYGRRGRPTENPRDHIFQLRLNHDEANLLDLISYATEDSKSDVIRKALKMYASVKKSAY